MQSLLVVFLNIFQEIINGTADWWVYAIIIFIPFSVMIAIREGYCWFNKVNKVVNRLERLDKRFQHLNANLEQLSLNISNLQKSSERSQSIKEDSFVVDKNWSDKKDL